MEIEKTALGQKNQRAITWKSLLAGLIGICIIALGSKISPTLAKQALVGHQLGIGIFFYFFLIALFWNPFFSFCKLPQLQMNIKELSVAMLMTLTSAGFAWIGWMKQLCIQTIFIPDEAVRETRWKTYEMMSYIKGEILPYHEGDAKTVEQTLGGFINGIKNEKQWISLTDIPFGGWSHMWYWGTLILLVALMCVAMIMIVNKQWIKNEKLSYPLASVAQSLFIKKTPGQHFADLFRSPLFWYAFGFVLLIHGYNYAVAANPMSGFTKISFDYPLDGLDTTFPIISKSGCITFLNFKIVFLLIGISYFLAPALSLSVGLNGLVYLVFAAQVYEVTGNPPSDVNLQGFRAGAYFAFVLMMIILGRRYYGPIMLKALTFGKVSEEDSVAVHGARLFILTALGTVMTLTVMGLDMMMALTVTMLIIIAYLVFTRIVCETGIPLMVSPFMPVTLISKMFGGAMVGPQNLLTGGSVSGVLFGDMKQLLMPYVATGTKLTDDAGVKLKRVVWLIMLSIVLAFTLSFVIYLWQYYSFGITDAASRNSWKLGITEAFNEISRLYINDQLKSSADAGFFERLSMFSPETEIWFYFLLGLAAVFFTGFMRTRFLWWPFHAVIFCIWKTAPAEMIWGSFFLGWMLRTLIVRFGGEQNYAKMKPFFFGLIYAEICAAGMIALYGLIYYLITQEPTSITYQVSL